MQDKKVSIAITTRNRRDDVLKCLESLLAMDYQNFETIVVDNGSGDGTAQAIQARFPAVKVIETGANLGLARGRNIGQQNASGEYILFLDSDTVVDKGFLRALVELAESDPRIAIVVPKIYYWDEPNRIWYAGATIDLLTSRTQNIGVLELDQGQYGQVRETSHGPTAFLVRRDVAERIGGHKEVYFMSYADADFAVRTHKAGYRVLFAPKAKIWHKVYVHEHHEKDSIRGLVGTSPLRAYYFARNRIIFMKDNTSLPAFLLFATVFLPAFVSYFVYKIVRTHETEYLKAYLRGIKDAAFYVLTGRLHDLSPTEKAAF